MLKTLKNAFKIKEIRNRILFTFAMLVVIRIASQLPVPGVDRTYFSNWFANQTGDAFNFFDAFTGGSFLNMSIIALNITPYITSSIIMQLLTIAIPKLEELQKDGEDGRKKIASITRYVTVGLALIESAAMAIGFGNQGLIASTDNYVLSVITVIAALTAGSTFLMWVGERITESGIGNGISIVLVINIVSRLPADLAGLYEQFMKGKGVALATVSGVIILAVILLTIVIVVILNAAVRKVPVQYAKKMQGNRMVGGQNTSIPIKVNTSGVIPIIFASSLFQMPIVISSLVGSSGTGIWAEILKGLNSGNWCDPANLQYSLGLVVYMVLVVFFAYFYTSITFNPVEIANNLKKSGGFIPGIRPGRPTSDYLAKVLNYVIFIGACGLIVVQLIPFFFNGVFKADVSFAGTSLIIIVSVTLDTLKQVESKMLVRNYKGFLND